MSLHELNLSKRTLNSLRREGIKTLDQITERRERDLWKIPNFGKVSMAELKSVLAARGLKLREL